jgi:hypothetical protein
LRSLRLCVTPSTAAPAKMLHALFPTFKNFRCIYCINCINSRTRTSPATYRHISFCTNSKHDSPGVRNQYTPAKNFRRFYCINCRIDRSEKDIRRMPEGMARRRQSNSPQPSPPHRTAPPLLPLAAPFRFPNVSLLTSHDSPSPNPSCPCPADPFPVTVHANA